MARIKLSRPALSDLDGIWDFIAVENQNPRVANNLVNDIADSFRMLAELPDVGISADDLIPRCRRFVVRDKYLVCYRPDEAGIQVVRVLDGTRYIHPGYFE